MNDNIKEDTFSTSDISLAAYLKCLDYKISNIKKLGSKITFIFKDSPKRKQDVIKFFNDEGICKVNAYSKSLKDLKGLIFNTDNSGDDN